MNYYDILDIVKQIDPKIKVIFSSVMQRFDNVKLQQKVIKLTKELKAFCEKITLTSLINLMYKKTYKFKRPDLL